jgi:hypothetical protein
MKPVKRVSPENNEPGSQDGAGVVGVQVQTEGRPGRVTLVRGSATELGGAYGSGNGQLDGSEHVRLTLEFQRTGEVGTLFSESLVPVAIPACVVVLDKEVEFPEVPNYGVATVAAEFLVSGRCQGEQRLRFAARSSHGDATSLVVNLTPSGEPVVSVALRRDSDIPGFSTEHASTEGLVTASRLELLPTLTAPNAAEANLRGIKLGLESDSAFVTLEPPRFTSSHSSGGVFVLDDDADIRVADEKTTLDALEARDEATLFGSDRGAVWLELTAATQRIGVNELAQTAGASRGTTKAMPSRTRTKNGRGGDDTPRMDQVEAWVGERLPVGLNRDELFGTLGRKAASAVGEVRKMFGEADFLNPTAARASAALSALVERHALDATLLKALLERFEVDASVVAKVIADDSNKGVAMTAVASTLLAHLDAKATAASAGKPRALDNDTARGIGIRVATSGNAATDLAQASSPARSASADGGLSAADRKLARALMVAEVATRRLSRTEARRVVESLNVLTLDVRESVVKVQRSVFLALLVDALKLQKQPDERMAAGLTEFLRVVQARRDKGNEASAPPESQLPVGGLVVRRWARLRLNGVNGATQER